MAHFKYDENGAKKEFLWKIQHEVNDYRDSVPGFALVYCSECNALLSKGDKFCSGCGEPLTKIEELSIEEKRAIFFEMMAKVAENLKLGITFNENKEV